MMPPRLFHLCHKIKKIFRQMDIRTCLQEDTCWVFPLLFSTKKIPKKTPELPNKTNGMNRIYCYL